MVASVVLVLVELVGLVVTPLSVLAVVVGSAVVELAVVPDVVVAPTVVVVVAVDVVGRVVPAPSSPQPASAIAMPNLTHRIPSPMPQ